DAHVGTTPGVAGRLPARFDDGWVARPTQPRTGQAAGSVPRSNQIRSPENRSAAGSQGKRMSTSRETARPGGGAPAQGPVLVPVSVATSNAPWGPMTISERAKALSGNAPNRSE